MPDTKISGKIKGKNQVTIFTCKECGIRVEHHHDSGKKVKERLCWKCQEIKDNKKN